MKKAAQDRLPDFIAVGPPRTATTWLHRVLIGRVGLPAGVKETQFFVMNYGLGLDWYRAFFRHCPPDLPAGEIAPIYFDKPEARERIAADIPGCKIICTLRDPVERVYSHYRMVSSIGMVTDSFDYDAQHYRFGACGSYAFNIKAWRKTVGSDRVLVLLHDDLKADPQSFLNAVCAFIGIAPFDARNSERATMRVFSLTHKPRSPSLARRAVRLKSWLIQRQRFLRLAHVFEHSNPLSDFCFGGGPEFPPLDPATETRIRAIMRPEIEQLEKLLQRDLSAWK